MTMSKRLSDENASFKIIYLHTYVYTHIHTMHLHIFVNSQISGIVQWTRVHSCWSEKKRQKQKQGSHPHACKTDTSVKLIIINNFFIPFIRGAM